MLRNRDRKQNESGRNTCLMEFIERLCACHRASIIYLLLRYNKVLAKTGDDSGSTNK